MSGERAASTFARKEHANCTSRRNGRDPSSARLRRRVQESPAWPSLFRQRGRCPSRSQRLSVRQMITPPRSDRCVASPKRRRQPEHANVIDRDVTSAANSVYSVVYNNNCSNEESRITFLSIAWHRSDRCQDSGISPEAFEVLPSATVLRNQSAPSLHSRLRLQHSRTRCGFS